MKSKRKKGWQNKETGCQTNRSESQQLSMDAYKNVIHR